MIPRYNRPKIEKIWTLENKFKIWTEIEILIDAHGHYNVPNAVRISNNLYERYNIAWFEEPVPPEGINALKQVKQNTNAPICVGERLYTRADFIPILENNLADFIMPDTIWTGGISEIKKIATMAEAYYIPVAPHVIPGGPLELIAAAHVMSSVPNFYKLEHSHAFIPEHNNLLKEPYLIKDGHIHLNNKPGLGFELDESKLEEIEKDIQDIVDIGDTVDAERRAAFDKDMTPDEIRAYGIKNRLPKAVIYKMLEKYHYITFFKYLKNILADGEVSDDEIDSLKGGYVESAQSITRAVQEALDKSKKLIFAFGRFNPPTTGHAKLMREVIIQARKNNANHIVYASASQDKRSNPLDVRTKVQFMKKMFPQNKIQAAGGTQRTFMEILKFYNRMYGEIVMIAGSDRINEFQKLADKYNGKDYNYKSIKVVSSGERDPDAEGVTGMSASKMREMAKNDDYRSFKKGVVGLNDSDTRKLFNAVRKGMDIRESYVGKFTDFVNNDIREEYHQERIFNVGDMVEHMNGDKGMVVRRGSNYVSYETDGLIKKAWLYDLQPLDEAPRIPRKKGQPAGSKKHSDLYTDENPKGTIQGLGFKDVETARASVSKIKNSGKKHAHKIQAAIAMEQRAKEMGKTREAAVYRRYIEQMKKKTKEMNKESLIDTLEKEMSTNEYYEIGTDSYVRHTMKMTPGQPIQNFRKYTEIIKSEDIEKFKNEEETIDKYKKRFKENWKSELDKAVEKMKEQL